MSDESPTTSSSDETKVVRTKKTLTLAEKILVPIAIITMIGWVIRWLDEADITGIWLPLICFLPALIIASLVTLKYFHDVVLPDKLYRITIMVASLLPLLGILVEGMKSWGRALAVGGAIVLAYISVTTFWRKHIPEAAFDPLGQSTEKKPTPEPETKAAPAEAPAEAPAPPAEPAAAEEPEAPAESEPPAPAEEKPAP